MEWILLGLIIGSVLGAPLGVSAAHYFVNRKR
jgi:uncharacterized membrane protein YfcA